jgi:hypothetical protein
MRLWWVFIRILCEIQSAMLKHVFKPILKPIHSRGTAFPNATLMMITTQRKKYTRRTSLNRK